MHASKVRVQNVFGFFTTVAFCVGILTALSVLLYPASPTASVDVVKVRVVKGRPNYYSSKQQEYAFITFDLDADLGSLYTWNTKQVFAWLSVSYAGDEKRTKHVRTPPSPPSHNFTDQNPRTVGQRSNHLGRDPAHPLRLAAVAAQRKGKIQHQRHWRTLPGAQCYRPLRLERAAACGRADVGRCRGGGCSRGRGSGEGRGARGEREAGRGVEL